jgi:Uma2 family endonuclease
MTTVPTIRPITAAAVAQMGRDKTFEVVDGEWVRKMMAGELHGAIATNLILAIGGHVKANELGRVYPGDTAYVLEGDEHDIRTMRLPDVSFVSAGRVKQTDREGFYYQAPDLAIEIILPSERTATTRAKLNDYLRAGTQQVWLVYAATQQVTVYRPDGTATTYGVGQAVPGGDLLPGLALDVAAVFEV